jgi:hypothetical protein
MIMSGDASRIAEMINVLGIDTRNLLKQAVEIAWYSRGSIQYETALGMSPLERDIVVQFVNDRLELQKKNPNPVY